MTRTWQETATTLEENHMGVIKQRSFAALRMTKLDGYCFPAREGQGQIASQKRLAMTK
jgi:hypothetical protein